MEFVVWHTLQKLNAQNSNNLLSQYYCLQSAAAAAKCDSNTANTRMQAQTHTYNGQPASISEAKNKVTPTAPAHTHTNTHWKRAQFGSYETHSADVASQICVR